MDRRSFIARTGLAAAGVGVAACGPKAAARVAPSSPAAAPTGAPASTPAMVDLVPVRASWDRVIRTTIGLRPHRPSGFVLRADRLDDKTLIHNYGHGGSGMSLSWGTARLAADIASEGGIRPAAVVGSGVVGLTTGRQLQRHGFDVTIYAMAIPPDTTSNMSLAGFTPTSGLVEGPRRTPAWDEQFRKAVDIAYRQLQLLSGSPLHGVSWVNNYTLTDDEKMASGTNTMLPAHVQTGVRLLQPGEHPFHTKYAIEQPEMRFEPSIYLDALMRDFLMFGGRIVIRKFDTPRDLMSLTQPLIVNCTGLGAKAIFGDEELIPLKGQLTVLVPQPEVTYGTNGGSRVPPPPGSFGIHMMPRSDGIILGGTSERGVSTFDVNESEFRRVVSGHIEVFSAMRASQAASPRTARVDAPRVPPTADAFFDLQS